MPHPTTAFSTARKGLASILAGWLAALLFESTGSWNYVFYGSAALAFLRIRGHRTKKNAFSEEAKTS